MVDDLVSWAGWYRRTPRGRWRLWCRGSSEQAVADQLRKAPPGDKLIRQGDVDPKTDETRRTGRC